MEVVFFDIFVIACAFILYRNRRKTKIGTLDVQNGNKYSYVLGDYMQSETSSFHGLDVTLPYKLANFYLDSHKDSNRQGPSALYSRNQMLSLEGDFNTYFQLFVPKDDAVPVLSILSPDIMQTLITSSQRYDVELHDQHLRIISNKKVYGTSDEVFLLEAAKAITSELDHRAASWQNSKNNPSKLQYRKGTTLKLAGRYLRRSRVFIGILTILVSIVLFGLCLALYYTHQDPNFSDPYSKGPLAGTVMYAAAGIFLLAIPIVMLAPLAWFFMRRPDKDIFPNGL